MNSPITILFKIVFTVNLLLLFSCADQKKQMQEENKSEKFADSEKDHQSLVKMEKEEFLKDARKSIDEANMRIEEFEADLYKYNEILTREMQNKINDLKAERDTVQWMIEEISGKSEQNWRKFHDNASDDLEELERAVRSFYNDYLMDD